MGNTKNALCVWDFTLSCKYCEDHKELIKELEQLAKKWTFQQEDSSLEPEPAPYLSDGSDTEESEEHYSCDDDDDGYLTVTSYETESSFSSDFDSSDEYDTDSEEYDTDETDGGYLHYQGKISLIKKKRLSELVSLCKANSFILSKAHWSPSSNNGLGSIFYVMKVDTRVGGPWADTDEKEIPMPRQLAHITDLRSWQQEIIDRSQYNWNARHINWLYDPTGNSGKSSLVLWCKVHRIMDCRLIPCLLSSSFLDLNAAVMDQPVGKLFFVDMPRALPKSKLTEFMAFLETLKSGYVYDKRYHFRERIFSSPIVWVMANVLPDRKLLSKDRLITWTIREDDELVLYPSLEKSKEPIKYPLTSEEREFVSIYWKYWYALANGSEPESGGVPLSDDSEAEGPLTPGS
jgi:hypothetical protein